MYRRLWPALDAPSAAAPARALDTLRDVLVLCYHAVSRRWPADLAVTPDQLARQLGHLVRRGYRGATFSEAVLSPPAERVLSVTFDDAYSSVIEHAFPILSSLGLPGTVFVVTDFVDRGRPLAWPGIDHWCGGAHDAELRGLSWRQLEDVAEAGWEVGSHSATHPRLTRLDDAELAEELRRSKASCEAALRRPCRTLAYPYGDFDGRVVAVAADAGYAAAGTLTLRTLEPAALAWPRVGIYLPDSDRRFRLKVSPALRRVRTRFAGVEAVLRR